MKDSKNVVLYGALMWLVIFVAGQIMRIGHVEKTSYFLFQSLFAVIVTAVTIGFSTIYFRSTYDDVFNQSVQTGAIWFCIVCGLELLIKFADVAKSKVWFNSFVREEGVLLLIIPIIVIGIGNLLQKRSGL